MLSKIRFAAVLGFVLASRSAWAVVPTIDDVPSATLLLPYFEVNLDSDERQNTLFAINNASATAMLVHVQLWTDFAVPTVNFDVYLTGYDVQTIDLRRIFDGTIPGTASDGQDPTDTVSPQGPLSQDINFASCSGELPPDPLPAGLVTELRRAHTGESTSSFGGNGCVGFDHGDDIARGFVTMDTVNQCNTQSPQDSTYVSNILTFQNTLWGDFFFNDREEGLSRAEGLVHVEADPNNPQTNQSGQYTFYMRHVGSDATDRREPLVTNFGARFLGELTTLDVWRDVKVSSQGPITCGDDPPWFPLGQEDVVAFDEQEEVAGPANGSTPFPLATQRVSVTDPSLSIPFTTGWIFLNLNTTVASQVGPTEDANAAQAWVGVNHDGNNRFSASSRAVQLDNASSARHFAICPADCP